MHGISYLDVYADIVITSQYCFVDLFLFLEKGNANKCLID